MCLDRAHAWEYLHDPKISGRLDAEGLLELCRQAGFSESEAQRAANQRANERLSRELPP